MLILIREKTEGKCVRGSLYHDSRYLCDTLENTDKAIPAGVYNLAVTKSNKFKREMPLIWNKNNPTSRGLRIHAGNLPSDSLGCVLVGKKDDSGLKYGSREYESMITNLCKIHKVTRLIIVEE